MTRRTEGGGLQGVLIVDKPAGPTSHDIVALARRLTGQRRIGHGGTLDPFAAGVLPLFLGGATRLVEYHLKGTKRYRATVCFGAGSTTDDLDGELTPSDAPAPDEVAVRQALPRFVGELSQRPPVYSAIQVGGRRAYALTREGTPPDLPPRAVTIQALELIAWDAADRHRPVAIVDVECSGGTYVRALARDLGEAVGSAAYLGALVRTRTGPFRREDATPVETLRAAAADGPAALSALLRPADAGLEDMPGIALTDAEVLDARQGRFIRPAAGIGRLPEGEPVRLLDERGSIVGIGESDGRRIAPAKMLEGLHREPVTADV